MRRSRFYNEVVMVAQLSVEKPIPVPGDFANALPKQQTIEIGKITLMLPMEVDPKPYIRQILRVDLESITHPKARECLEFGLQDATTDSDFSSLIETFHIFSSEANAARFFQGVEAAQRNSGDESIDAMNVDGNSGEEESE
jgi:hypothetical protein